MKPRAIVILIVGVLAIGIGAMVFLKSAAGGFSARDEPTFMEKVVARAARSVAVPGSARSRRNPTPETPEVLADARAHWADHCAGCHANNGSGDTEMGRNMYPRAPDMRQAETQNLTDGELFFVIENGVRLTGMPGWGGSHTSTEDSWKLVRFVRHLPRISEEEARDMRKLNPMTRAELQEEREVDDFLKGGDSQATERAHSQH